MNHLRMFPFLAAALALCGAGVHLRQNVPA